jgi:hypothetical protein
MDLSHRIAGTMILAASGLFMAWAIMLIIRWTWPHIDPVSLLWGFLAIAHVKLAWEMFRE